MPMVCPSPQGWPVPPRDDYLRVPRTVVHTSVWWSLYPRYHSLFIPVRAGAVTMKVVHVSPGLSHSVPVPPDVAGNSPLAAACPEQPHPGTPEP